MAKKYMYAAWKVMERLSGYLLIKKLFWLLPVWLTILIIWSPYAYATSQFSNNSPEGRVLIAVGDMGIFIAFIVYLKEGG